MSWTDEFTDYERWQDAGEPGGHVWGTNWSLAYPGLLAVRDSPVAAEWSRRLGKDMFEITLETNRFFLRLIFHSVRAQQINDNTDLISQVLIPLKGSS